jgi:hypothetical protein
MKISQTKCLVYALIGRFASIERVVTTEHEGLSGQLCILGAYVRWHVRMKACGTLREGRRSGGKSARTSGV